VGVISVAVVEVVISAEAAGEASAAAVAVVHTSVAEADA
jgi:hypothetical protein